MNFNRHGYGRPRPPPDSPYKRTRGLVELLKVVIMVPMVEFNKYALELLDRKKDS
jgi:hypothetical protein